MRALTRLMAPLGAVVLVAAIAVGCQSTPAPAPTQAPAKPAAAAQPTAAPAAPAPAAKAEPTKPAAAAAPAYPTRPIEFVIPFAPGGGSGITAEVINKAVVDGKLSPQPLNITYKPGGGGAIGWAYLAGRKGDGHTIATSTLSFVTGPLLGQSPLKLADFTPIALMAVDQSLMVAYPNSPFKTMQEVIEASKKSPKSIKVAGTGATGSDATIAAMIEQAAGIKFNLIPFNSGAEVNAAILGGQVDLAISNPNELFPNIEAGKLRPMVVFSDERMSKLKDIPTMKEVGYKVVSYSPRGIVAAAGIAKNEQEWLSNLMKKVTESKEWAEYVDKNLMTLKYLDGPGYGKMLADDEADYTAAFKSMGILKKQ